jgi:hypothetical protein
MPRGQRIKAVNRPAVNRVTTEELQRSQLREEAAARGGTTQFINGCVGCLNLYWVVCCEHVPSIMTTSSCPPAAGRGKSDGTSDSQGRPKSLLCTCRRGEWQQPSPAGADGCQQTHSTCREMHTCRLANQWMGSGAAGTVEETQRSVRGNLRHVMGRLNQHIETIRQEGWEAIEDRLDPGASRQRGRGRGGGYYESAGDNTVQSVWESFFERMLTLVDSALCEGWIVPDDLSEPFIQVLSPFPILWMALHTSLFNSRILNPL